MNYKLQDKLQCREVVVKAGEPQLVPPATETPNGFYYLSNLDQITNIVKTVYCFKCTEKGHETAVQTVKDALARILVHYYPLAGHLMVGTGTKLAVDCTAEGVVFVEAEAEADCDMEDIANYLSQPDSFTLGSKLVCDISGTKSTTDLVPPLGVQVTKFKCGGFALGIAVHHSMFDGISAMEFFSSWGRNARSLPLSVLPFLDRSVLKPHVPPTISYPHHEYQETRDVSDTASLYKEELLICRSFLFDPEDLDRVKSKALENGCLKNCTSFEALTALMWRYRTDALKLHPDQECKLLIAVDCHQRLNPPLPKGYFGNSSVLTSATTTSEQLLTDPLSHTVGLVQAAIQKVTDGYIRSAIDYLETKCVHSSLAGTLLVSTWSRLAFHETDFGWGQPTAFRPAELPQKEVILFLAHGTDRRSVGAVVCLPSSAMAKFQDLVNDFKPANFDLGMLA